jgi:hypothetical protein
MEVLEGLGTGLLVALGLLLLVQITLQVIAIVQLISTPAERVTIGGRKWAWALIILLVNTLGAISWFFLGRTPAPADSTPSPAGMSERSSAVDTLYGETRE